MNEILSFIQIWGAIILSALSLLIALISLAQSAKTQSLQNKINKLELKLKEYELAKIDKEQDMADKACVEARVIQIGKNAHKLKIWNSGNATAYNVTARFEDDPGIIVLADDKMPFDELEPNKYFELNIVMHMGSASKFKILTEWNDKAGQHFSKSQMGSR